MMHRNLHQWHWSVTVLIVVVVAGAVVEGKPSPLSHQQQLRRRGINRSRVSSPVVEAQPETTEAVLVDYAASQGSLAEQEKHLKAAEQALKSREQELEKIKAAFMDRERILEDREFAADVRDAELDQRSKAIDKQVMESDQRLKEREDRIAAREVALSERESEILKLAEQREQEIGRLSRERENANELREKALESRERALAEREQKVEEREVRVQKRMEHNRKRFRAIRELQQLDQRIGLSAAPEATTVKSHHKSKGRSLHSSSTAAVTVVDQSTQATTNHPRRVIEKVTLRKVTSAPSSTVNNEVSPAAAIPAGVVFQEEGDTGVTTALSPDEQFQVTEAVAYESAKEFGSVTSSPVKGETTVIQQQIPVSQNSIGEISTRTGKKRKSGKRRARQRRQGHGHHESHSSTSSSSSSSHGSNSTSGRKHKVRKVVKMRQDDGTMVIVSKHDQQVN